MNNLMQLNTKLTTPAAGCEDRTIQGAASAVKQLRINDTARRRLPSPRRSGTAQARAVFELHRGVIARVDHT
jgi:hypothetical protein